MWANQAGNSNNGSHPVSGNRQFGLRELDNGGYEFYIRAADRGRINFLVKALAGVFGDKSSTEVFFEVTDLSLIHI